MILQKLFKHADLVHFILSSILKTVLLLNSFVETVINLFQDFLMNSKLRRTAFICN